MMVFWWQNKGYQTLVIVLLTLCAFGLSQAVLRAYIPDRPWVWGLALIVAAAINWRKGTELNERSLNKAKPGTIGRRLFYKASHRFMSMPMETFSIVLAAAGVFVATSGFKQG